MIKWRLYFEELKTITKKNPIKGKDRAKKGLKKKQDTKRAADKSTRPSLKETRLPKR